MKRDYVLLRAVPPVSGAGSSAVPNDFEVQGPGPFNGSGPTGGAPPEIHVSIESLSGRERDSARKDGMLAAPLMPTKLIRPTAETRDIEGTESWALDAVGATGVSLDGSGVTVTVLDTGIDGGHDAFKGMTLTQVDFTGEGVRDRHGHGTHCAGTIFGRDIGDRRIGVARGVTNALIGKVLDGDGAGTSDMVFRALQWALDGRAHVISMSLGFDFAGMAKRLQADGWPEDLAASEALQAYRDNLRVFDALMDLFRAYDATGRRPLVIAAAGNESRRDVDPRFVIGRSLPSDAVDVISVAAASRGTGAGVYGIADFSNGMPTLSAPGVDIVSAAADVHGSGIKNGVASMSGTSMACPHVAGLAALYHQQIRNAGGIATSTDVAARLIVNAKRDVFDTKFDPDDYGRGLAIIV